MLEYAVMYEAYFLAFIVRRVLWSSGVVTASLLLTGTVTPAGMISGSGVDPCSRSTNGIDMNAPFKTSLYDLWSLNADFF